MAEQLQRLPAEIRLDQRKHSTFTLTAEFAGRVRQVVQTLPTDATIHDLFYSLHTHIDNGAGEEWADFLRNLSRIEKGSLTRALGAISYWRNDEGKYWTLEDFQEIQPEDLIGWRATQTTADFLSLAFNLQPTKE